MRMCKILMPAFVLALAIGACPGCSSQQQTRTVETTTRTEPVETPTQTKTTTTTTTTTADSGHDSLLGATAHFVWTVVTFPFYVVAGVIGDIV